MRQHSKVVHASSGGVDLRAAKVQERMASSISVDWGAKRAPMNPPVTSPCMKLIVEEGTSAARGEKTLQGGCKDESPSSTSSTD
jgi:hypothetical protein